MVTNRHKCPTWLRHLACLTWCKDTLDICFVEAPKPFKDNRTMVQYQDFHEYEDQRKALQLLQQLHTIPLLENSIESSKLTRDHFPWKQRTSTMGFSTKATSSPNEM